MNEGYQRPKKQVNVAVTDDLRSILESRAARAGHTLSEEMRRVLWAGLALKAGTEDYQREVAITNEAWSSQ